MRSLAFFISAISAAVLCACAAGSDGLDAIQTDIRSDFETVAQLSADDFLALDPENILLLDIREPNEYAVSRLPGATWVSPNIDAQSALIQIGDVRDKQIVVYCSVGVRSSAFAKRAQADLLNMGAVSISNLERGIFGWHNDKRALVDANGVTDAVHPYDAIWKRYVERKEMTSFIPLSKK